MQKDKQLTPKLVTAIISAGIMAPLPEWLPKPP